MKKIGFLLVYMLASILLPQLTYSGGDGTQKIYGKEAILFPEWSFEQDSAIASYGYKELMLSLKVFGGTTRYCPIRNTLQYASHEFASVYSSEEYGPCILTAHISTSAVDNEILRCLAGGAGSGECGIALKTVIEKQNPFIFHVIGIKNIGTFDRGPMLNRKRVIDADGSKEGVELEWISAERTIPKYKSTFLGDEYNHFNKIYDRWKGVNRSMVKIEGFDLGTLKAFEQFEKDEAFIHNYINQRASKLSSTQLQTIKRIILEKIATLKSTTTKAKTLMHLSFIEDAIRKLSSSE